MKSDSKRAADFALVLQERRQKKKDFVFSHARTLITA